MAPPRIPTHSHLGFTSPFFQHRNRKRLEAEVTEKELLEVCSMLKKKLKITGTEEKSESPPLSQDPLDALAKELKKLVVTMPERQQQPTLIPVAPLTPAIPIAVAVPCCPVVTKFLIVVPDTNCFIDFLPQICTLRTLSDIFVKVPMAVVRELDGLKTKPEVQRAARDATNFLFSFIRESPTNFAVQGFHEMARLTGVSFRSRCFLFG